MRPRNVGWVFLLVVSDRALTLFAQSRLDPVCPTRSSTRRLHCVRSDCAATISLLSATAAVAFAVKRAVPSSSNAHLPTAPSSIHGLSRVFRLLLSAHMPLSFRRTTIRRYGRAPRIRRRHRLSPSLLSLSLPPSLPPSPARPSPTHFSSPSLPT